MSCLKPFVSQNDEAKKHEGETSKHRDEEREHRRRSHKEQEPDKERRRRHREKREREHSVTEGKEKHLKERSPRDDKDEEDGHTPRTHKERLLHTDKHYRESSERQQKEDSKTKKDHKVCVLLSLDPEHCREKFHSGTLPFCPENSLERK